MTDQQPQDAAAPRLDFDGDYGRTYRHSIRSSVPGYDSLIEIAAAALQQTVPAARSLLVVGPGLGEELLPILSALPQARITVLEPSPQMAAACSSLITQAGASERCALLLQALEPGVVPEAAPFDAVICHNVLHLMPAERQEALLHTLAGCLAPAGALVLSAYSEPSDAASFEALLPVAITRLRQRGMSETLIDSVLASRNRLVFSVDQQRLQNSLTAAGLTPALLLQQALFSRLWLSRRPG
jgi:SAM-dependent methyltransferase